MILIFVFDCCRPCIALFFGCFFCCICNTVVGCRCCNITTIRVDGYLENYKNLCRNALFAVYLKSRKKLSLSLSSTIFVWVLPTAVLLTVGTV